MNKKRKRMTTAPDPKPFAPDQVDPCGTEVSAEELIVALCRKGVQQPLKSFPNTPEGHREIGRYLARSGRRVRVCMESTGVYGLDLALALAAQAGIQVRVANPRAARHDPHLRAFYTSAHK